MKNEFEEFDKGFKFMRNAIIAFIVIVFCCIIATWVIIGTVAVKATDKIEENGLRSVIEQVWCPKGEKCLSK